MTEAVRRATLGAALLALLALASSVTTTVQQHVSTQVHDAATQQTVLEQLAAGVGESIRGPVK